MKRVTKVNSKTCDKMWKLFDKTMDSMDKTMDSMGDVMKEAETAETAETVDTAEPISNQDDAQRVTKVNMKAKDVVDRLCKAGKLLKLPFSMLFHGKVDVTFRGHKPKA